MCWRERVRVVAIKRGVKRKSHLPRHVNINLAWRHSGEQERLMRRFDDSDDYRSVGAVQTNNVVTFFQRGSISHFHTSASKRPPPALPTPRLMKAAAVASSMTFSSPFCTHHPSFEAARGGGGRGVCGVIHRSIHPSNMIHGTAAATATAVANSNDDPAPSIMPMVAAAQLQGSACAAAAAALLSFLSSASSIAHIIIIIATAATATTATADASPAALVKGSLRVAPSQSQSQVEIGVLIHRVLPSGALLGRPVTRAAQEHPHLPGSGLHLAKPYSAKLEYAVQESAKLYFAKPGNC